MGTKYIVIIFFFISTASYSQQILPDGFPKRIEFGMSMTEFQRIIKSAAPAGQNFDFRTVFLQENINKKGIESIAYYFDMDGEKPLYEVIILYNNAETALQRAKELFGEPNYDNEWRIEKRSKKYMCWVYQNKIVVVENIPYTEWDEDGDGEFDQ